MNGRPENRRQHTRITLTGETRVATEGGGDCLLVDISLGGARLRTIGPVDPARSSITVTLDDKGAVGEVIWRETGEIGIRFREAARETALSLYEHVILSEYRSHVRPFASLYAG